MRLVALLTAALATLAAAPAAHARPVAWRALTVPPTCALPPVTVKAGQEEPLDRRAVLVQAADQVPGCVLPWRHGSAVVAVEVTSSAPARLARVTRHGGTIRVAVTLAARCGGTEPAPTAMRWWLRVPGGARDAEVVVSSEPSPADCGARP